MNIMESIAKSEFLVSADKRLVDYAMNAIKNTIPKKDIENTKFIYQKTVVNKGIQGIEIAIITNNNGIIDFTFYPNNRKTSLFSLSKDTVVNITTTHDTKSEVFISGKDIPSHRINLEIWNFGRAQMGYSAEGGNQYIKQLNDFAMTCITIIHSLREEK